MSQAGTINGGGSGPPANPAIPTSFTLDLQDTTTPALSAPLGTAVPQLNVLRIGGDNGIKTYQIVNQPGALTVGFIRGDATTVGAATSSAITQAVPTNSTMILQIIASGFANNNDGCGIYGTAVVKNVAGTVTVINTVDKIVNADASLANVDLTVTGSGSNFIVSVVGVAGRTITWNVVLPGVSTS
jgi:hypothetical protein